MSVEINPNIPGPYTQGRTYTSNTEDLLDKILQTLTGSTPPPPTAILQGVVIKNYEIIDGTIKNGQNYTPSFIICTGNVSEKCIGFSVTNYAPTPFDPNNLSNTLLIYDGSTDFKRVVPGETYNVSFDANKKLIQQLELICFGQGSFGSLTVINLA
jgi:hypothetical protein